MSFTCDGCDETFDNEDDYVRHFGGPVSPVNHENEGEVMSKVKKTDPMDDLAHALADVHSTKLETPKERRLIQKASRRASELYLGHMSPRGAAAYFAGRNNVESESDDNNDELNDELVRESDSPEHERLRIGRAAIDRAAALRKADPSLSRFEALKQASRRAA